MTVSDLLVFLVLGAGTFGLIVGSFANVIIYRLPLEVSIVFPGSRCPTCEAAIRPWQNIPVISWLLLRGRCASCQAPISARYPSVEALHGLGFILIVLRFGPEPFTLLLLLFFSALVVLALIDWDHQILPDVITLPGILIGIAGSFLSGALVDWKEASLSAFFGYVAFFLVAKSYAGLRGIEGLGQGDWKLAAMMGAMLGAQRLMLTVFIGSLSGVIYGLIQALRLRGKAADEDPGPETASSRHCEGPVVWDGPKQSPERLLHSMPTRRLLRNDGVGFLPQVTSDEVRHPLAMTEKEVKSAFLEDVSWQAAEMTAAPTQDEPTPIGRYKLPFGTFLAAAAVFVLFFGDAILVWYGSLFR